MKHVLWGSTLLFAGVFVVGCVPSPSARCFEFEHEVQTYFDRCGVTHTFHVVDPRDSSPVCGRVNKLVAYDEVAHVCYPFLHAIDCTTIDPADPLATLPPECAGSHFQFPP